MADIDDKKTLKGLWALKEAFRFVFSNIPHLLQTSILTLFLIVLCEVFLNLLPIEGFNKFSSHVLGDNDLWSGLEDDSLLAISQTYLFTILGIFVISTVLSGILLGIFAIRWHRSTLLGPEGEDTGFGFEFSRSLWTYIGRAILILLIQVSVVSVVMFVSAVMVFFIIVNYYSFFTDLPLYDYVFFGSVIVFSVVNIITAVVAPLYIFSRFSLALPAAALKIDNFGLDASWQATKGHAWGLMGIYLLTLLLTGTASGLLMGVTIAVIELLSLPTLLHFVPYAVIVPFIIGIYTSLTSFVYLQLGEPPVWIEKGGSKS